MHHWKEQRKTRALYDLLERGEIGVVVAEEQQKRQKKYDYLNFKYFDMTMKTYLKCYWNVYKYVGSTVLLSTEIIFQYHSEKKVVDLFGQSYGPA